MPSSAPSSCRSSQYGPTISAVIKYSEFRDESEKCRMYKKKGGGGRGVEIDGVIDSSLMSYANNGVNF